MIGKTLGAYDVVAKLEAVMQREHTPERKYAPDNRNQGADTFVK